MTVGPQSTAWQDSVVASVSVLLLQMHLLLNLFQSTSVCKEHERELSRHKSDRIVSVRAPRAGRRRAVRPVFVTGDRGVIRSNNTLDSLFCHFPEVKITSFLTSTGLLLGTVLPLYLRVRTLTGDDQYLWHNDAAAPGAILTPADLYITLTAA